MSFAEIGRQAMASGFGGGRKNDLSSQAAAHHPSVSSTSGGSRKMKSRNHDASQDVNKRSSSPKDSRKKDKNNVVNRVTITHHHHQVVLSSRKDKGKKSSKSAKSTSTKKSSSKTNIATQQHPNPMTRGPRPRLDYLQHPVSRKILMDEITEHSRSAMYDEDGDDSIVDSASGDGWSAASQQSSQDSSCVTADESTNMSLNKSVESRSKNRVQAYQQQQQQPPPRRSTNKPSTQFAKLSTEIAQFQKMVAQLEGLFQEASSSPEAMWKSRILQRSATEQRADLQGEIQKALREMSNTATNHKSQYAAQQKLQRDWNRAQQHLEAVLQAYHRRRVAELSTLGAVGDGNNPHSNNPSSSYPMLQEEKEDFFDRAMRERHEEVQRISQSMNKIQDIYTDLAGMVDQQQEQIDELEDTNDHTKAQTKAGLEEIQYTMWNMCAARPDDVVGSKHTRTRHASESSPDMWNLCAGQEGSASRSFDNNKNVNHTHKFNDDYDPNATTANEPYAPPQQSQRRDARTSNAPNNTPRNSWANMKMQMPTPQDLETLQANVQESTRNIQVNVQESAQGALVIGNALVQELVSQVQQQVGDGERDMDDDNSNSSDHKKVLEELMKKWNVHQLANRLSCTSASPDIQTMPTYTTNYSMDEYIDERGQVAEQPPPKQQERERHSPRRLQHEREEKRSSSRTRSSSRRRSSSKQRSPRSSSQRRSSSKNRRHQHYDDYDYHRGGETKEQYY